MNQPTKDAMRLQLAYAADTIISLAQEMSDYATTKEAEIIRLNELLDGLSDGGWWNAVGVLGFGFVAGAIAGSVLVLALGWLL